MAGITGGKAQRRQGAVKNAIDVALAPENRGVLTAVGLFAVRAQPPASSTSARSFVTFLRAIC